MIKNIGQVPRKLGHPNKLNTYDLQFEGPRVLLGPDNLGTSKMSKSTSGWCSALLQPDPQLLLQPQLHLSSIITHTAVFMHFCIISNKNSHDNLGHILTPSTRFSSQNEKNFEEEKKRGKILPVEEITRPCLILQIMSSRKNFSTLLSPYWPPIPTLPVTKNFPLKYFPSVPKNHLNTSQVFPKITFVVTILQSS